MKLQSNSSQVDRNTVNARFSSHADIAAEANKKNINRIDNALNQFKAVHMQKEEEKDVQRVIAANNEYDRRVLALGNEVREQFKEADAVSADGYFKEQEALIRKQVFDGSGIRYEKSQLIFNNRSEDSAIKQLDLLKGYQQEEEQKYKGMLLDSNVDNGINRFLENGSVESFQEGIRNCAVNVEALGFGQVQTEQVKKSYLHSFASRSIQGMLNVKNYEKARELLEVSFNEGYIDEQSAVKLGEQINRHINASEDDRKMREYEKSQGFTRKTDVVDVGKYGFSASLSNGDDLTDSQKVYKAMEEQKQAINKATATKSFMSDYLASVEVEGYSLDSLLTLQEQYADSPQMQEELGQMAFRLVKPDVRRYSDDSAVASLRALAINGDLTQNVIDEAFDKGLLSKGDYQNFLSDSLAVVTGEVNEEDKKFDRFWLAEVNDLYGAEYESKERDRFINLAWEKLQSDGVTGAKRQELVGSWLELEKSKVQKQVSGLSPETKQAIIPWGLSKGKEVLRLLEKSGDGFSATRLAVESEKLAAYVKNYASLGAQEALGYRLSNDLPVSVSLLQRDVAKKRFEQNL